MKTDEKSFFLECEKHWTFWLLIMIGGFYGAYTYTVRGGVFCNAQTANVVLLSMAIGTGNVHEALYLLVPISSYFLGTILSEILGKKVKKLHFFRWDTILIGIEILVVIVLGLLPKEAPDQICQVTLNFICAMQFNTYRQNEGIPMATTFVTNHIRQTGSNFVKAIRDKDAVASHRYKMHGIMLLMFLFGGILSAIFCSYFDVKAILCVIPLQLIVFIKLAIADRTYERELLEKVPRGH
ncbi:MAG: DUF1275 domain-containing protein [Lachnospiraceae bacterium]|nr:DUF1275 domain-containing protein [Lachnospiraceae bacterium]